MEKATFKAGDKAWIAEQETNEIAEFLSFEQFIKDYSPSVSKSFYEY